VVEFKVEKTHKCEKTSQKHYWIFPSFLLKKWQILEKNQWSQHWLSIYWLEKLKSSST
jgi:hypothetical protein